MGGFSLSLTLSGIGDIFRLLQSDNNLFQFIFGYSCVNFFVFLDVSSHNVNSSTYENVFKKWYNIKRYDMIIRYFLWFNKIDKIFEYCGQCLHKRDNIFGWYFARWCDAVPMFETIGRSGNFSTVPYAGTLLWYHKIFCFLILLEKVGYIPAVWTSLSSFSRWNDSTVFVWNSDLVIFIVLVS